MTFTYTSDLSTPLAKVRHLLQDVDSTRPLLQDAEINFHLTNNGSDVFSAAADAALAIAAYFGRKISRSAIDVTDDPQQTAQFYSSLAGDLRSRRNALLTIHLGGSSKSRRQSRKAETDRVEPSFEKGMDDSPEVSNRRDIETNGYGR